MDRLSSPFFPTSDSGLPSPTEALHSGFGSIGGQTGEMNDWRTTSPKSSSRESRRTLTESTHGDTAEQ